MKNSPSEGETQTPVPCPECQSTRGYVRRGKFRVHCLGCNALIKNEEVNMQLPDKEH